MEDNKPLTFAIPQPETELSKVCQEVSDIAGQDPKILESIAMDQLIGQLNQVCSNANGIAFHSDHAHRAWF